MPSNSKDKMSFKLLEYFQRSLNKVGVHCVLCIFFSAQLTRELIFPCYAATNIGPNGSHESLHEQEQE